MLRQKSWLYERHSAVASDSPGKSEIVDECLLIVLLLRGGFADENW